KPWARLMASLARASRVISRITDSVSDAALPDTRALGGGAGSIRSFFLAALGHARWGSRQAKAGDDLVNELGRGIGRVEDEGALGRLWRLQVRELAVQKPGTEEVAVPGRQPGVQHVPAGRQEGEARGWPPVQQQVPVAALEQCAGRDRWLSRRDLLGHSLGDDFQTR